VLTGLSAGDRRQRGRRPRILWSLYRAERGKEAHTERPVRSRLDRTRGLTDLGRREIRGATETKRSRLRDGSDELWRIAPAGEGRLDDGMANAEALGQTVAKLMPHSPAGAGQNQV